MQANLQMSDINAPQKSNMDTWAKRNYSNDTIALCCYTNVKWEIKNLSLITSIAPIFLQFNYFRQNLEQTFTFTFYFFSFASNFPYKVLWDNNNIDANICIF